MFIELFRVALLESGLYSFMFLILYRVLEGNLTVRVHGYEVFECRIT